jgi:uncharacterized protein YkwD
MRRFAIFVMAGTAFASGCGGSGGGGGKSTAGPASTGATPAVTAQATDGRLGPAVVARPGKTTVTGRVRRITGRSVLPPSTKHALGAEANCADADVQPTPENLAHVSDVIFCLMNAMRQNEGLPGLKQQDQLAKASVDHSQDMVDNKYFAHDSLDGRDVVARLKEVAYIPKTGDWVIGENLAWGAGALATPKSLVNAWMNSPPHRENLLSGDFKEVGMGVVFGTPSKDATSGVTVSTDFGTRIGAGIAGSSGADTGATGAGGVDLGGATETTGSTGTTGAVAAKRRKALRRCTKRQGKARRRCVKAARRIRR